MNDQRNSETEAVIRRVCEAAVSCASTRDAFEVTAELLAAIDAAMSHAYAEGRSDEREEWIERTLRAMNESGQGEHMGLT